MEKYFKIGEISKLYGIGVDSIRYYEEIGLIKPERWNPVIAITVSMISGVST